MEDIEQKEVDPQAAETPYTVIAACSNEIVVKVLEAESPHTAALIIGCLPLEKKAAVFEQLLPHWSEDRQKMLMMELTLGTSELAICMELIAADIAEKIKRLTEKRYIHIGGIDFISKTINLMDIPSRNAVFSLLKDANEKLYENVKADTFTFDDIVRLSDLAIQKMMRETDAVQLSRALVTAPADVKHKILQNMSKRAAAMLEEEIESIGHL